jgi:hypothetical protein
MNNLRPDLSKVKILLRHPCTPLPPSLNARTRVQRDGSKASTGLSTTVHDGMPKWRGTPLWASTSLLAAAPAKSAFPSGCSDREGAR